jgi:hypothetical protein
MENTSRREVLFIMLSSLVVTWPAGLYNELGTCTCAIRRVRLEIVNIEILLEV